MSSSRSIAAARARRAGDPPNQPPQQNRPVTSINSQAAFAPQRPPQPTRVQQQAQPAPQGRNVRVASAPMTQVQGQMDQHDQSRRAKLSISDAIGLITLRLGRVESILIEKEHEEASNGGNNFSIPDNTQLVDKSILANIVARIDSLEKNNKDFSLLTNEIKNLKEIVTNINVKYDTFAKETSDKFDDYEVALADIEKQIPSSQHNNTPFDMDNIDIQNTEVDVDDVLNSTTEFDTPIISSDLKTIIQNELANNK